MRYIVLVLAALFVSAPAYAASDGSADAMNNKQQVQNDALWDYASWDANNNDMLEENEFYAGYEESGLFEVWDTNDDGSLDQDEFGEGLYGTWDANDDGMLEADELEENGFWDW